MTLSADLQARIAQCSSRSLAGECTFGDAVASLAQAGVDAYFADFRAGTTTYYVRAGGSLAHPLASAITGSPADFDAGALQAAIRDAQRDAIRYPEFMRRAVAAGCVGYHVWIAGTHVAYLGARGETHVERFPGT